MKKNFWFIMAAAVFAACSNGESFDEREGGSNNTSTAPAEDSEIEVAFGKVTTATVKPSKTRAAFEDDHSWNGEEIAIWGVDSSISAQWNSVTSHIFKQTDPVTANVAWGGDVQFKKTYYYPMSSNVNYSFYSCYPVPDNKQADPRSITCSYPIDGKTDIMWGKAECPDGEGLDGTIYSGYNALYFRKVVGAQTPELNFQHCLSRLDFVVAKGVDGGGKTVPVAVRDIKVLDVPTSASLKVIGDGAGLLTENGATGQLPLFNGDIDVSGTLITPVAGRNTTLGTVLLMPSKTRSYRLSVTLEALDEEGNPTGTTETGEVTIASNEDFAANTQYKVTLTVYGLQIVTLRVGITKWATGTDITQDVN